MDHPCYKCGQIVEDGKAFCSQCGAPQIRVIMPEATAPAAITEGVSSTGLPVFSTGPLASSGALGAPTLSAGIHWPTAMPACLASAAIAALVMSLGLMVPLLAVLGAGFLAVILYSRRNPAWTVNARSGAQLGAVCGLMFFGISAIFETLAVTLFHTGPQLREKVLDALRQAAARSSDPEVQAAMERLKTPEGIVFMMVFGLVLLFIFSIAAGSLAGALTGAFLGRRNRP
jgi:predicted  nucleic acid-binding Zn-ribbon protein